MFPLLQAFSSALLGASGMGNKGIHPSWIIHPCWRCLSSPTYVHEHFCKETRLLAYLSLLILGVDINRGHFQNMHWVEVLSTCNKFSLQSLQEHFLFIISLMT